MFLLHEDPNLLLQIGSIVLLDLLLAGDNALVIAMAVRLLPDRQQRLGRLWGTFGAVALRIGFLAMATWLLTVPYLRLVGGVLLVWIAWKLLSPKQHGPVAAAPAAGPAAGTDAAAPAARAGQTLGDAIRIIIIADVSMSIDNVLAVTGAAHGHLGLAVAGIALSIPLVVWGSALLSRLMQHHVWIVWLGGAILGHVGGSLILEDPRMVEWFGAVPRPAWHWLSLGLGGLLLAYGAWSSLRRGAGTR